MAYHRIRYKEPEDLDADHLLWHEPRIVVRSVTLTPDRRVLYPGEVPHILKPKAYDFDATFSRQQLPVLYMALDDDRFVQLSCFGDDGLTKEMLILTGYVECCAVGRHEITIQGPVARRDDRLLRHAASDRPTRGSVRFERMEYLTDLSQPPIRREISFL